MQVIVRIGIPAGLMREDRTQMGACRGRLGSAAREKGFPGYRGRQRGPLNCIARQGSGVAIILLERGHRNRLIQSKHHRRARILALAGASQAEPVLRTVGNPAGEGMVKGLGGNGLSLDL